jgi:hypothetical protein
MDADAYRDRAGRRPGLTCERLLDGDGRRDGVRGCREDGEPTVALTTRTDMDAPVLLDGLLEQGVVAGGGAAHRLVGLLPERGAALDVGEEEGHRASR